MNKIVIIDTGVDINSTYIRKYVKDIVGIKVKNCSIYPEPKNSFPTIQYKSIIS